MIIFGGFKKEKNMMEPSNIDKVHAKNVRLFMERKKHSRFLDVLLFSSFFLLVLLLFEGTFRIPENDFFSIFQRVLYFLISLAISGTILACFSKNIIWTVILVNFVLLVFVI